MSIYYFFNNQYFSKATNFNADIGINNGFKSFANKAKSLEDTVAGGNSGTLKNATTALPKYLSNFWRLFEMSLVDCKMVLKIKRTKYCILAAAGSDNTDANPDIIFAIKDTEL